MKEGRDLAVTLIASTLLLLGMSYLTQCSASSRPPSTAISADGAQGRETASTDEGEREEAIDKPESKRQLDEDEGQEEREKIQRVGRALQTIGANPELRKTLGIPR